MNTIGGGRLAHSASLTSAEQDAPVHSALAQICAASPYGVPPSLAVRLTVADLDLLIEALARSAARLESMARSAKFGRKHDESAVRMRALRLRLMRQKIGRAE